MASTIQIKRGTGSAVPTGLEDGELAINLDNGKLYFGSGSTSINSFRFENLTAENYIVSSSVTNITTQELSGSTNFGDSSDDTHTFTGNITASGNISSSGNVYGDWGVFANRLTTPAWRYSDIDITSDNGPVNFNDGSGPTATINCLSGEITASGNISSSGNIYANEFYADVGINDGYHIGDSKPILTITDGGALNLGTAHSTYIASGVNIYTTGSDFSKGLFLDSVGNITASNDISASGIVKAYNLHAGPGVTQISHNGRIYPNYPNSNSSFIGATVGDAITINGGDLLVSAGNFKVVAPGGGHITASGNISASGNITASGNIGASGEVKAASFSLSNGAFIIASNGNITTSNSLIAGNSPSGDTHTITGKTTLNGHITASGDISASGTIYASSFDNVVATNITASGDISASGAITASGFSGTTISANRRNFSIPSDTPGLHDGDAVYFGGTTSMTTGAIYHYKSDGTWELADADAVATSDGLLGVALGAASDTNGVLLRGIVTLGHDAGAVGDVLYVSTNPGSGSATAPSGTNDVVRIVGYKIFHATKKQVWFNPSSDFIIHA